MRIGEFDSKGVWQEREDWWIDLVDCMLPSTGYIQFSIGARKVKFGAGEWAELLRCAQAGFAAKTALAGAFEVISISEDVSPIKKKENK